MATQAAHQYCTVIGLLLKDLKLDGLKMLMFDKYMLRVDFYGSYVCLFLNLGCALVQSVAVKKFQTLNIHFLNL